MGKICGIYGITNSKENEIYVGSSKDIARRWSSHMSKLKSGTHRYTQLKDAFNENVNNLKWEIISECSLELLEEQEIYFVDYFKNLLGINVINKMRKIKRCRPVADTTNMKKAQSGQNNGNAKLNDVDVLRIKQLLNDGVKVKDIAKEYNISLAPIYNIKNGKTWLHIN